MVVRRKGCLKAEARRATGLGLNGNPAKTFHLDGAAKVCFDVQPKSAPEWAGGRQHYPGGQRKEVGHSLVPQSGI